MQLLRHAPIGVKVSLAPAFAIVCLVVVVAMSQWASVSASRSLAEINRSRVPALSAAAELGREIAVLSGLVNQSLVWEGAGVKADRIAVLDHQIARTFEDMGQRIRSQRDGALWSSDERQKFAQIEQTFQRFRSTVADTLDIKSTGLGAASGFITRSEASSAELQKRINELVQGQQARTGAVATDAEEVARRNQATTLAALVAAVVLASAATWWCARLIVKPLAQASAIATAVAAGDLHTPTFADIRDQTGMVLGALRKVTQSLTLIVGEIRDSAGQIDLASNEIAKGNNRLSERTSQAAAAVEQTAAALEQLTALVRQSAVNAVEADKLAIDAASVAHQGAEEVSEAVRSMEETSLQAKRIGEIVSVIDGIAFQTNILALNAAVEAARAGESGRGFAVVAQEVRVLASRSGEAAKQIRDLIGQSVASIQAGAGKVQTAGSSMANIVQSIERVSGVVNQISRAAAAQATGIEQINLAVVEMDRFTRQNATLVEEALATAGSLKHQSSRLVSSISVFRT